MNIGCIEYENGKIIEYSVNKGKRKNIYISIQEGQVVVKVPLRISDTKIKEVVESKKKWIYEKAKTYSKTSDNVKQYVSGEYFKILGQDFILDIIYDKNIPSKIEICENKLLIFLPMKYEKIVPIDKKKGKIKKLIDEFYFNLAQKEVEDAMNVITEMVGIYPNKYRIRRLKKSWGICSSTRNITINVNLVKYSKNAIRYVVLHEVCHLKYMNHSKKFWELVKNYMNDYKMVQQELKH